MTRTLRYCLAVLLSAAALLAVIRASAEQAATPPDPPAGQLLIASAALQDPRFQHSVILLVRHDQTGAFGLVINRLLGERPLAALLAGTDRDRGNGKNDANPGRDGALEGTIRVFLGGPVQPQFGFVIHSGDYRRPETLAVANGVALTASKAVLRDIGHHKGPVKYLFALGYAGWGKGQLEGEIARHDWFTTIADPDLVFDVDRGTLWQTALARRTHEL